MKVPTLRRLTRTVGLLFTRRLERAQRVEEVLLACPSASRMTVLSSFATVTSIFFYLTKDIHCSCRSMCDFKGGWIEEDKKFSKDCPHRKLWNFLDRP